MARRGAAVPHEAGQPFGGPSIARAIDELSSAEGVTHVRYVFDAVKFRREASYHMWSSKLWGIALFAGFFSLLALGSNDMFLTAAIYIGIIADLEGLAISMILRDWKSDVPTLLHALRLRRIVST